MHTLSDAAYKIRFIQCLSVVTRLSPHTTDDDVEANHPSNIPVNLLKHLLKEINEEQFYDMYHNHASDYIVHNPERTRIRIKKIWPISGMSLHLAKYVHAAPNDIKKLAIETYKPCSTTIVSHHNEVYTTGTDSCDIPAIIPYEYRFTKKKRVRTDVSAIENTLTLVHSDAFDDNYRDFLYDCFEFCPDQTLMRAYRRNSNFFCIPNSLWETRDENFDIFNALDILDAIFETNEGDFDYLGNALNNVKLWKLCNESSIQ